ncbi:hypothetical protein AMTR_s00001p00272920 [Amborella trichopoda]|uniref:Uncharacterized protein n=1 Tax=Amborella trichopoda TaxID=13333 RepID=W1NN11_AMBTC|nr:hypothetical protein AMTR_s00001p00272920 [Amborella trichopoda]
MAGKTAVAVRRGKKGIKEFGTAGKIVVPEMRERRLGIAGEPVVSKRREMMAKVVEPATWERAWTAVSISERRPKSEER